MTGAAIVSALAITGGVVANAVGQHKMNKEMEKANKLAADAAKEQKNEIAAQKAAAFADRKELIDDQRLQLGAGLGFDGIVSTKYKPSVATPQLNILG
jgi:hypothetical protein